MNKQRYRKSARRKLNRSPKPEWRPLSFSILTAAVAAFPAAIGAHAADVDVSKLPPPATGTINFDQQIKPIFDKSCIRCHGPERPRGGFRLDYRENALKGGDNGVAIIPGKSAESPLIHYVARLVEDMEMPPEGKGDPLTSEQIGLLRAWIDQGAAWSETVDSTQNQVRFSIVPAARWVSVQGNERQFREHAWMNDGWAGGFQEFSMKQRVGPDKTVSIEGRSFFNGHDHQLKISAEKQDFGFARFGFEQYRRYYNDNGGYYEPFGVDTFSVDRDLHVDLGRVWIDFGLTIPDWPRMTLGYEYQYKDGTKSTLQWGDVYDVGGNVAAIYPAYKGIDESTHILKLDISHEINGFLIEDSFRGEFYDLATRRENPTVFTIGNTVPDSVSRIQENYDHFNAVNTLRAEKQLKDWLFVSSGYLYSKLDGDASFSLESFAPADPVNSLFTGEVSDQIVLDRQSHVFNANTLLGSWAGLTFSAGIQSEWTREKGMGESVLPGFPDPYPKLYSSDRDKMGLTEDFGVRYTGLPFTVLFAETRFRQEALEHFEEQFLNDDFSDGQDFLRDTDATDDLKEVRTGFNISPWRRVALHANYKYRAKKTDYDDDLDTDGSLVPGNGYPGFIREREINGDEIEAKLITHWASWIKTTFKYQLVSTEYVTVTDPSLVTLFDPVTLLPVDVAFPGGSILAGNYDAHVYSISTTLTPWRRLYLATTFSLSDSRTSSGVKNQVGQVPYKGDVYSVLCSANYILSQTSDWNVSYSFSRADYRQNVAEASLPLGIAYDRHGIITGLSRKFKKNITTNLQYGFFHYDEPTSGGANDYRAHAVFASIGIVLE